MFLACNVTLYSFQLIFFNLISIVVKVFYYLQLTKLELEDKVLYQVMLMLIFDCQQDNLLKNNLLTKLE